MKAKVGEQKEPLEGLRVLDLSTVISGGVTTSMLADFGAEVIKVEHPRHGDPLRQWPPFKEGVCLWWKVASRNKKSITLDLSKERGQVILKKLVEDTDILVESFRPRTLERWNIGYNELARVNPHLIMVRISGYGQDGPYSERPGFGTIAEARSGMVYISGFPDTPPLLPAFPIADEVAGLFGALSAMFAIYYRDIKASGGGQYIDVSLYEPLFRLIIPQVIEYDQLGIIRERNGNRHLDAAPRNLYQTKDSEWVALSASTQSIFERVMRAMGREDLINDPRFQDNRRRIENVEQLDEIISGWMRDHNLEEILARFEEVEAVISPVYNIKKIFKDPQYIARKDIIEVEDPELGRIKMQNVIPKFSKTQGRVQFPGPKLGAHNRDIYIDRLGYSEEELSKLEKEGVI